MIAEEATMTTETIDRYVQLECPKCHNIDFGIVMVNSHPYYYCYGCDTHFIRWDLERVPLEIEGRVFEVYDSPKLPEPKLKKEHAPDIARERIEQLPPEKPRENSKEEKKEKTVVWGTKGLKK